MRTNLGLKILVLFIAFFLWFQQQLLKLQTVETPIEIQYKELPPDLIIMPESAKFAVATITARGLDILFFKISRPNIIISASDFRYGKNNIDLSKHLVNNNENNIQIKQIEHKDVSWAATDRLVIKEKQIKINFLTSKDEEFFMENKFSDERLFVNVKGPLSVLNEISQVQTEKVSKKMVREGFLKVELTKPHELIELIDKEITIQIMQSKIINKTISLIPVQFPLEQNVMIIPQKVTVMIRGPEEIVEKLNFHSIKATIKVDKTKKNDVVDIQFDLPVGVKLIDHTPQKIQVIRND
jgi:hypothetical protein